MLVAKLYVVAFAIAVGLLAGAVGLLIRLAMYLPPKVKPSYLPAHGETSPMPTADTLRSRVKIEWLVVWFVVSFLLTAIAVGMPLMMLSSEVYIVEEVGSCHVYLLYGDTVVSLGDGRTADLRKKFTIFGNHHVVNATGTTLVVDNVWYGDEFAPHRVTIDAHSVHELDTTIEYFFKSQPPPEQIESDLGGEVHQWLRVPPEETLDSRASPELPYE